MKQVKINRHDMMTLVNPCSIELISKYCFARCCRNKSLGIDYALIMPFDEEIEFFLNSSNGSGAFYDDKSGIIRLKSNLCPFQDCVTNLCTIHNSGLKPFGCRIMPLMIINDELKVRSFIKYSYCQKTDFPNVERVPFYIGFRQSLAALLGEEETNRIAQEIENGSGNISVNISQKKLEKVKKVKQIIGNITKFSKQIV